MESKILETLKIDPAYIFLFILSMIVILFILYVNLSVKYNRLQSSYNVFMKGRNGKTLEEVLKEKFGEVDAIVKVTRQNRFDIKEMSKKLDRNFRKTGIVKYDAFNEMGGKLSFSLALLNEKNDGFIINAMHSREGCYTYIKEIIAGKSIIVLTAEETEALDMALNYK